MNRNHQTSLEFGWNVNVEAALAEQFPSYEKVMQEKPGSERDREMQEFYRAENQIKRARQKYAEQVAILITAQAAAIKRTEQRVREKQAREYKNHLKARASSGPFAYPKETAA